jgi:hypothetical protein
MPSTTFRSLTIAEDIDFPNGLEIVYATGPWGHGSGLIDIRRAYRMGGEVHHEVLRNDFLPGQQLRSIATGPEGTPIFASVCRGDVCGYEGGPKPDVASTIYRSDDLGVTWREVARKPGEQWLTWLDNRPWSRSTGSWDPAEGYLLEALDGSGLSMRSKDVDGFRPVGHAVRPTADGRLVTASGAAVVAASSIDGSAGGLKVVVSPSFSADETFGVLEVTNGPENSPRMDRYFAWFTDEGKVRAAYGPLETEVPGIGRQVYSIEPVERLAGNRWLVSAEFTRPGLCTSQNLRLGNAFAVLDLEAGTLSFIKDFVRSTPQEPCGFIPGGGVVGLALLSGTLYRVNTPGSCLNLRRTPGAGGEIINCLGDGAIITGTGPVTRLDGRDWVGFFFPSVTDQDNGVWAALEFLEPLR